jgi:hypothetical protein
VISAWPTRALEGGAPQTRFYFIRARAFTLMKNPAAAQADLTAGLTLTPTSAGRSRRTGETSGESGMGTG